MRNSGLHQLVIASCMLAFSILIGINANAGEVENLIRNGDFEEGLIEWKLRTSEGAIANMEEDKGEGVKGKSCVFIEIDAVPGKTYWHLSLYQEGHRLEAGKTYTFSFWAKAEELRPVAYYVEQTAEPWDEYGRKEAEVNEEWQEYWTTFTAPLNESVWPRIALGESDVDIWVDTVRFYEGEYVEEEGLGLQKAIHPQGNLFTTWAEVKRF